MFSQITPHKEVGKQCSAPSYQMFSHKLRADRHAASPDPLIHRSPPLWSPHHVQRTQQRYPRATRMLKLKLPKLLHSENDHRKVNGTEITWLRRGVQNSSNYRLRVSVGPPLIQLRARLTDYSPISFEISLSPTSSHQSLTIIHSNDRRESIDNRSRSDLGSFSDAGLRRHASCLDSAYNLKSSRCCAVHCPA